VNGTSIMHKLRNWTREEQDGFDDNKNMSKRQNKTEEKAVRNKRMYVIVGLSVCLCLRVCLSVFVYGSVCLFVCLSVHISVSLCLFAGVCLPVGLSVCLSEMLTRT